MGRARTITRKAGLKKGHHGVSLHPSDDGRLPPVLAASGSAGTS